MLYERVFKIKSEGIYHWIKVGGGLVLLIMLSLLVLIHVLASALIEMGLFKVIAQG